MPTPAAYGALRQRTAASLQEVHSALDDALGDTDVTHMDDDELRDDHPVQWAAQRLAEIIQNLKD